MKMVSYLPMSATMAATTTISPFKNTPIASITKSIETRVCALKNIRIKLRPAVPRLPIRNPGDLKGIKSLISPIRMQPTNPPKLKRVKTLAAILSLRISSSLR